MDRQLSIFEQFDQIMVTESHHDHFKIMNTNPLAEMEPEKVMGEWFYVHPIRYTGRHGKKNVWRL